MNNKRFTGEDVANVNVRLVTRLSEAGGIIGRANPLDEAEIPGFEANLGSCIVPINKVYTADCVDARRTIALADGTNDPQKLANRIAHQLPGGLGLAITKAAVGADLAILKDAKNFQQAYETMVEILASLGYEDGGHVGCGASKMVEQSVRPTTEAKRRRLEAGFYSAWSNGWHEDFLSQRVPQNFSVLETRDDETNGHYERGAVLLSTPGIGFAKNKFIDQTGQQAFADTVHLGSTLIPEIIIKIGGSSEERARLAAEFDDEPTMVLNQLVTKDFPVFAEGA